LLAGADGSIAWISSNQPLSFELPGGDQIRLETVHCPEPRELSPAGRGKLLVTCRSGHTWLIGADEPPARSTTLPGPAAATPTRH
jgi:hypothetical protein